MLIPGLIISSSFLEVEEEVAVIKAFPGAEGVGTDTIAGRGGTIIEVTNINNSGAGSLREALTTSGARTIVFNNISGVINLTSEILVIDPFFTLSTHTSPGKIVIAGFRITINTNDCLIQETRFRTGTHNNGGDASLSRSLQVNGDGVGYANPAYNVVIDHCSFAWGTDQTLTVQEDAYDITISWCAINEAHDNGGANHGYSMFFWGKFTDPSRSYSVHHNYTSNSRFRNPEINFFGRMDLRNHVNYNSILGMSLNIQLDSSKVGMDINSISNYNRYGPNTLASNTNKPFANFFEQNNDGGSEPKIYTEQVIGEIRTLDSDPEINAVGAIDTVPFSFDSPADSSFFASVEYVFSDTVTTTTMDAPYATNVVTNAGARIPSRDTIDARCIVDFDADTGRIIESTSYPSDWTGLTNPSATPDTDTNGDFIPDGYETYRGFTIGTMTPLDVITAPEPVIGMGAHSLVGYTWIEAYHFQLKTQEYVP